ncbi:hypothetical protein BCV72DRAFT_229174 [Rhizopus microsporus var. microsporus]|uniref:Uncharacterized protein n=2 Tax=Rhizopus microsporus TaxID=58291 RepID=A0A2G4SQ32_RHIZD|nr:uncharacterized protein RHIMIDRAFT_258110 [Rhizopus microsporus ATCC 52813]ORE05748.1 hypothetical protein BCV72DRAFT_229174 [Rhizopus microsporus var. microsporus]PHZ10884.1 hypothetical protein RHIMIDRAFT_258110 [Rhizopus microsporus ATCC 52813]
MVRRSSFIVSAVAVAAPRIHKESERRVSKSPSQVDGGNAIVQGRPNGHRCDQTASGMTVDGVPSEKFARIHFVLKVDVCAVLVKHFDHMLWIYLPTVEDYCF